MADVFNNEVLTLQEITTIFESLLKDKYPTLYTGAGSIGGNMVFTLSYFYFQMQDKFINAQNESSLLTATGENLDNLAFKFALAKRLAGAYTTQIIKVKTTAAKTLYGLDQTEYSAFTVADLNNNKYILLNTQQISSAGEYNFTFISEIKGAIQSNIGTIVNFITKEPYVESVINEVSPTEVGFDYETDPVYRERIILSRELNALNTTEAITSQLLNTLNVNDAICYPVNTIAGIPANMLYVIVDGGSSADIAKVLATNSSCTAYHGSNQYFYATTYGVLVETKWDNVALEPIYLKFKIKTNSSISPEALNNVKSTFVNLLITKKVFKLSQKTNISILIPYLNEVIQNLKIDGYVYDVLLSINNINFFTDLTPALVKNRFDLIANNITIEVI
jgi:hypothetical protein